VKRREGELYLGISLKGIQAHAFPRERVVPVAQTNDLIHEMIE
jgi:hypothetical protein